MLTIQNQKVAVVVPWHSKDQILSFLKSWRNPDEIILQRDENHEGCAKTKNKGVATAIERGADVVVILDDDCFPDISSDEENPLEWLCQKHVEALQPQPVEKYIAVSSPQSRGTPYFNRFLTMPVAASIGFVTQNHDYDAAHQLVCGASAPMNPNKMAVHGVYFSLCGMNIAFRPADWLPWCQFIDVPRWDDIWMGIFWQKEAYRRGFCFNLCGPVVRHERQSNVFKNLRAEAAFLDDNETLWQTIHQSTETDYHKLVKLLPC